MEQRMLNHRSIKKLIVTSVLVFGCYNGAHATSYESLQHINEIATGYVQKNVSVEPDEKIEVKLSEAANQLRLTTCSAPIAINLPAGSAQQRITTLEMTCAGEPSWHVYVPVDMKILTKVVSVKETIPGKTLITDDMLELGYQDKNLLYLGYFKDFNEVVGQVPVSTLVPGTVLTKKNIQQPIIVNRNQSVSIVSRHGNIMVRADGIAKANGAVNDTIKVLNTSSKKILDAVVVNSSTVEVMTS
jgi:flagella basal body P-ring formation protein FlgA